jgi:dTDP-4-dehydrorhamnose reductase
MRPLRIAVTGTNGQVARSLLERSAATACEVVCIGRPMLDLARPETIEHALAGITADVLVNAAAYTDVNKAEAEPDLAELVNAQAAGMLAAAAHARGFPLIHLSTDYVFDGSKRDAYVESDALCPINAYGRSKANGERVVAAAHPQHVILRTAWLYSPINRNFVRTMLALARSQSEVRVVADQTGNPTAADEVAESILMVARNLAEGHGAERYGTFHIAANGAATWAEFATAIFAAAAARGGPSARVVPIASADYQTPAQRPANSRLDCTKIARVHGVSLPHWQSSLGPCVGRILEQGA